MNQGPVVGVRYPERLWQLVDPYVDYLPEDGYVAQCNLPSVSNTFTEVELETSELQAYQRMLRKHRRKADRMIMSDDLDDDAVASGYRRVADLRQVLLGDVGTPSSKVRSLCESVRLACQNPGSRILVFSNFVEHGVTVISEHLTRLGIQHSQYVGGISKDAKEKKVAMFKSGDKPVLVLSPVGFEGLDLVGTTHVYIADPHYNPEVTAQLVARATRAGGEVKEVNVEHFLSTARALEKGTIDQAIYRIAHRKAEVNSMIKNALSGVEALRPVSEIPGTVR
jgi:SNF2 family DNA or RNA helicase